ncbi:MAG: DUF1552 domain-containing protein [Gammaproteobacteria bacterium]|nr:DUF1552 domain-containing protein [Gammaproteobacteria bacterium]
MSRWTPATDGTGFEFPPILSSLEPFRDRLNVISDLTLPLAYGQDASAGANHTRSSAVWITGAKPEIGSTPRLGTSVDQIAARHFGQDTPLPSLEVSIEEGGLSGGSGLSGAYRNTIAWRTPTAPLPMENDPQVVFERLFGDGSTPEERTSRRRQAASLLDSVVGDIAALKRTLPADDGVRLDRYLEDVREVERRIALAGEQVPDDLELPPKPTGVPDDFEEHVELLFDLIALAWQADMTRVATMMIAKEVSNAVYRASGVNDPFHNLSHHSEVPANIDRLATLNEYHTRVTIGYFLGKLRETPDGDGNLLDHSLVLHGSGMSNSNQHDHDPLPILLAGGASGRLRGGRHIRAGRGTPMANLLVSLLNKLDVPAESFGDSTAVLEI